jgi:hypothetical protein
MSREFVLSSQDGLAAHGEEQGGVPDPAPAPAPAPVPVPDQDQDQGGAFDPSWLKDDEGLDEDFLNTSAALV